MTTPIFEMAQVAAGVTATTTFLVGAYKAKTGRKLPSFGRYVLSGTVSLIGAALYCQSAGRLTGFDLGSGGQIFGAFGLILTVSSQLYDKGLQPVKKAIEAAQKPENGADVLDGVTAPPEGD